MKLPLQLLANLSTLATVAISTAAFLQVLTVPVAMSPIVV
jgi:hypothetical protein